MKNPGRQLNVFGSNIYFKPREWIYKGLFSLEQRRREKG